MPLRRNNDFEYNDYNYNDIRSNKEKRKDKSPFMAIYLFISIVSVCIIFLCAFLLLPQFSNYYFNGSYAFVSGNIIKYDNSKTTNLKNKIKNIDNNTIANGVYIDGLSMGGKTKEEARVILMDKDEGQKKTFSVNVKIAGNIWQITPNVIKVERNIGNTIEKAYSIGRTNSAIISGTKISPLEERYKQLEDTKNNHINLYSEFTYNKDSVKKVVSDIAKYVYKEPVDSQIAEFDFNTRQFTFTENQDGVKIDEEKLYNDVIAAIDKWEENVIVEADPQITLAKIRKHDLMNNFKLVAAYTTKAQGTNERLNNIDLACKSINGKVLMPGEEFSFNKVVGQRTIENGYKAAGTIAKGQLIQDVGGGICQVSTTLFNAAVRADLNITKRNNHAWPISYISVGEDAAVNWPNLDLKFKNNKDTPIFIIMYYNKNSTSAEIYGMTLGDDITIDLESKVIYKSDPPSEPEMVYNPNLPYGTSKTVVKARTGYKVETYKIWKKKGKEIKREKLHTTEYKPYQEKIEYNDNMY